MLVGAFAVAALLLAALGVYGVVAQVVGRSTREIGLRVALGATRASVVGGVLSRALKPAAWGAVAGLAGSLAVARLLRGLLFGVAPADPAAIVAAAVALLGAAALAAWLPARRAGDDRPRERAAGGVIMSLDALSTSFAPRSAACAARPAWPSSRS